MVPCLRTELSLPSHTWLNNRRIDNQSGTTRADALSMRVVHKFVQILKQKIPFVVRHTKSMCKVTPPHHRSIGAAILHAQEIARNFIKKQNDISRPTIRGMDRAGARIALPACEVLGQHRGKTTATFSAIGTPIAHRGFVEWGVRIFVSAIHSVCILRLHRRRRRSSALSKWLVHVTDVEACFVCSLGRARWLNRTGELWRRDVRAGVETMRVRTLA